MNCSDSHIAFVCNKCGGILSVYAKALPLSGLRKNNGNAQCFNSIISNLFAASKQYCRTCEDDSCVRCVHLPYVFRYLSNELAGMGIKMSLKLLE